MSDPTEAGIIEAMGTGSDVFDGPSLFFLTFEEEIRRWAHLSGRAQDAIEDFLTTLEPDLAEVAERSGLTAGWADTSGGYRHLLIRFPSDPPAPPAEPCLAFCFGWNRRHVRVTRHTYNPFAGVRVSATEAGAKAREQFLGGADGHARTAREAEGYRHQNEWPAWVPVVGEPGWWSDLDAYRLSVTTALPRTIELFFEDAQRAVTVVATISSATISNRH